MAFITLKCPSCGAALDIDDSRELAFCSYCGTKMVQEKTVIEHRGTVSVDGIATKKNLIQRASVYLKDGDFFNAEIYFNRTLDTDPKCSQAYWGLLLCKYKSKNNTEFVSNAVYVRKELKSNTEFLNACDTATEEELAIYKKMESIVLNGIIKSVNEEKGLAAQFFKFKKNIGILATVKRVSIVCSAITSLLTLIGISSGGVGITLFFAVLWAISVFGIVYGFIMSKDYVKKINDCYSKLRKFPDYKTKYVFVLQPLWSKSEMAKLKYSLRKRWWLWLIAAFIIIGLFGAIFDLTEETSSSNQTSSPVYVDEVESHT